VPQQRHVQFLDLTLPTPHENVALDEALWRAAEADGAAELLRVWESPTPFVVLGRNCSVVGDVWLDRCAADGVPVLRRTSGGGTVLVGPGCLNYTLVLRYDRAAHLDSISASFDYVLDRVLTAIRTLEPRADRAGLSDLVVADRKFCGNAQRRGRTHFLHHGSILCSLDLRLVTQYLREPGRQPAYRAGRQHSAFLTNVRMDGDNLRNRLKGEWNCEAIADRWPRAEVAALVEAKYSRREWTVSK
jgi:lipoate-protein ligase A